MSCEKIQSNIGLYLYGELSGEETEAVEAHAEHCAVCGRAIDEERRFFALLNEAPRPEASDELLAECRDRLMRSVDRGEVALSASSFFPLKNWRVSLRAYLSPAWAWRPAAALALLALAFVAGRSTTPDASRFRPPGFATADIESAAGLPANATVAGIRSIEADPERDNVEIIIEETTRRTLSGRAGDPRIRHLLLSAMRNAPSSGMRLATLDILTRRGGDQDALADRDVRRIVAESMLGDANPGVRLLAIDALKSHSSDPEVRRSLVEVVRHDLNPGMRVQAIDLLTQRPDRDLAGVLQELVERDTNRYVRLRSRRTLEELNASVERF